MTKTEFIEAVKMLNEDKDKAISIYGDPETWDLGIGDIGITEAKITEDHEKDIDRINPFEKKIKGLKKVSGSTKVSDLVKLIETKEVYLFVEIESKMDAFYQYNNSCHPKLTNFSLLEEAINSHEGHYDGLFNPMKEIHFDYYMPYQIEYSMLPAMDIIDYLRKELYNKKQLIDDIHEGLNQPTVMPSFTSDEFERVCNKATSSEDFDKLFDYWGNESIIDSVKRIYLKNMFPEEYIEINSKAISYGAMKALEENYNEMNKLTICELEDHHTFENFITLLIWDYTNLESETYSEEYSWSLISDISDNRPEISFMYK